MNAAKCHAPIQGTPRYFVVCCAEKSGYFNFKKPVKSYEAFGHTTINNGGTYEVILIAKENP